MHIPNPNPGSDDYAIWEERYSQPGRKRRLPDSFLRDHWSKLVGPRVLDVACGEGRNALFLAERGFQVTGIDRSPLGIAKAQEWAASAGLAVEFICLDLEKLIVPGAPYDSIVVTRYWQPDLCPILVQSLRSGGILLYETYTKRYLNYRAQSTPSHLLRSGELPNHFSTLDILFTAEVDKPETQEYCAQLLARRRE